ncbi:MAG: hypothetical protein P4L83_25040, partial [Nevskia sp.]|nr:hypothetical protein [Nevskia sp.]
MAYLDQSTRAKHSFDRMLSHDMHRRIAILGLALFALFAFAASCPAMQIGAGEKPPVIRQPKKNKKAELPNQALENLP